MHFGNCKIIVWCNEILRILSRAEFVIFRPNNAYYVSVKLVFLNENISSLWRLLNNLFFFYEFYFSFLRKENWFFISIDVEIMNENCEYIYSIRASLLDKYSYT